LELPAEDKKVIFGMTLNKLEQGTSGAFGISASKSDDLRGFGFYFSVNKSLLQIESVLNDLKLEVEAAGLGTKVHVLDHNRGNEKVMERVIAVDKREALNKQIPGTMGRSDFKALYKGAVAAIAGVSSVGTALYIVLAPNYNPAFLAVFGSMAVFNGIMSAVIGKNTVKDYHQEKKEEIAYTKASPSTSFVTLYASESPYGFGVKLRSFRDRESREAFMRLHE
jgi:hypothetical protein